MKDLGPLVARGHAGYIIAMLNDLRRLLAARPFVPFTIFLADGGQLRVPTADHAAVAPTGARVIVFADDDSTIHVSPLLISRIAVDPQTANASVA